MKKDLNYYLSLKYPVIILPEDDGSYFIKYPDLPGCMSCGETMEEAITMGEDARAEWTEMGLEHDDPIPEPFSNKIFDSFKLWKKELIEARSTPDKDYVSAEDIGWHLDSD